MPRPGSSSRKPFSRIQSSLKILERYFCAPSARRTRMFSFLPVCLRVLDRAGDRRAARAADEEPLEAHQIARHEEALLVVDADDLVDDLEVHRRREEVFADALDLVGEGLGDAPRLDEVVIERADRIDADDLRCRASSP